MPIEQLSVKEMYTSCLKYCQICECPRTSEDERAYCMIYCLCDKSFVRENGKFSRIPVLTCVNLERAYERIKKAEEQTKK